MAQYKIDLHNANIRVLLAGTLFLWLFWPSFNGCLVAPDYLGQHRAVVNTYYSLCAACVTAFALSPIFDKKFRLNMVSGPTGSILIRNQ